MKSTDTLTATAINLKGANTLMKALKSYDFKSLDNGIQEILVNEGEKYEMTFYCRVNHKEVVNNDFDYFSGTGSDTRSDGTSITEVQGLEFFIDGDTAFCEYINPQSIENLLN